MASPSTICSSGTEPTVARLAASSGRSDLALVPLRVFLGATFAFAGLQKLASTAYLDPTAKAGVSAQLRAASTSSPIGGLLGTASHHAAVFGLLIACGELAVGIGTLLEIGRAHV